MEWKLWGLPGGTGGVRSKNPRVLHPSGVEQAELAKNRIKISKSLRVVRVTNRRTDGQTDRRTDGQSEDNSGFPKRKMR